MVVLIFCRCKNHVNTHWKILGCFAAAVLVLITAYFSFGVPIACGTHGCLRAAEFTQQRTYDSAFALSTQSTPPSIEVTLTTVLRRYLLAHAILSSPISLSDAARYRIDVLHMTDDAIAKGLGFFSLAEYDERVIVPFITQEALMQERHLDTPSTLYAQLAQEQWLLLLKPGYRWDRATGEVVAK